MESQETQKKWLSQLAYLEQDDCIVPQQTVKEYIHFSVKCRISKKQQGDRTINSIVEDVMGKLHIDGLKDTKLNAISGGERKRVMIAVEFAVGADILILDEATSGLDSHLALNLVDMVKKYAVENNKIVIMIVHQPGSGLFEMFDYLLFLNRGSVIYSGPVSKCDNFLSSKGISRGGTLSKSEFLFELFSKDSVIPEIREHRNAINEMAEAAFEEGQQKIRGKVLKSRNDFMIDFSLSIRNSLLIAKRQIIHDWRTWGILKRWLVEMVFMWFFIWMGMATFVNKIWRNLSIPPYSSPEDLGRSLGNLINNLKENFDGALYPKLAEAIKWGEYPFLLIFTSISSSTLLDDTSYISREAIKGTYSIFTLYLSLFMTEYLFAFIRCGIFFGILATLFKIEGGFTSALLTYVFVGSLMAMAFNLLIKCFTSSRMGRMLLAPVNTLLTSAGRPLSIPYVAIFVLALVGVGEDSGALKWLKYLRYFTIFWPHIFFEAFMNIGFIKRVLYPSEAPLSDENLMVLGNAAYINPPESEKEGIDSYNYFFVGEADKSYPDYVYLIMTGISLTLVISLSIYFLISRFSPRLRLKLSN